MGFFTSSLCYLVELFQRGSDFQLLGNPIAVGSICGYESSKDFRSFLNLLPYPIESSQYVIQHIIAYTLFASIPSMLTHVPRKEAFICGALGR